MSYMSLITRIQDNDVDTAVPYMIALVERVEAEENPERQFENLLAQSYFVLCRYYYNRYVETRSEEDQQNSILYGRKLRERFPEDIRGAETLTYESQMYFSQSNWEALEETLQEGLDGVRDDLYPRALEERWLKDLCLAFAIQEKWVEGEERFRRLFDLPLIDIKTRTETALYLIRSYQEQEQPEKMLEFIPFLSRAGESRYDPGLNLALFKLGNQFSDNAEYTKGNYLYFLTLTLEDIIDFNEQKLTQFESRSQWYERKELAVPEDLELDIEQTAKYLAELKNQSSYTSALKYHRARNLERMERRYDAFYAFLRLVREHPEDSNAELFNYSSFNQATNIGYVQETVELGERYLARDDFKTYRPAVFVKLIATQFNEDNYAEVHALGRQFMEEYPDHDFAANVIHFMGYAWTKLEAFETLKTELTGYLEKHPDSPMSQSANYWIGITLVVEQDFEKARTHFQYVVDNFKGGSFYSDSRFRLGVCEFGIGDYETAEAIFNQWVEDYANHHLRGEAEVFLGDIAAINAMVPEALAHYASVEQYTSKINLIDHAYFESSRLLEANGRYQEIIELLETYTEKFSEGGSLSRAVYRIGEIYEILDQPAKMLESYLNAIREYGNLVHAEGVDQIILRYVKKYRDYLNQYTSTRSFLKAILERDDFRLSVIADRKALHFYRLEHPDVSKQLIDLLLRDEKLRTGLGPRAIPQTEEQKLAGEPQRYDDSILPEARERLEDKLAEVQDLIASFPDSPPAERFTELYHDARKDDQRTFVLRLLVAFDALGIPAPGEPEISVQDLPKASPATLAWIGSNKLDSEPELARLAVERIISEHPFSLAVPEAQRVRAELLLHDGDRAGAITLYRQIIENNPLWPKAPQSALRIGDLYMESGEIKAALEQYQSILQVREWRGVAWAEACFKIGQCFAQQNEPLKAHGYYERTYLSYLQFPEWAGRALYEDGKLLEEMNEIDSARSVYREYMNLPNAENLTNYDEVKRRHEAIDV